MTVASITKNMLLMAGKIDPLAEPSADETADGLSGLNRLLAYWAGLSIFAWQRLVRNFALQNAKGNYTIGSSGGDVTQAQPVRLRDVALWTGTTSLDRILRECETEEWERLPTRNAAGTPRYWYWQPGGGVLGTLYVSPILAVATGKNIQYLATEPLTALTSTSATLSIPAEWELPLQFGLAGIMGADFGMAAKDCESYSQQALGLAKGLIA